MSVVPVILAAGASTRMGRSKPLLDFDGRTCLELAIGACKEAGTDAPVVVLGHEAEAVRRRVKLDGLTVVVNAEYEKGQTSSLKAGLRKLPEKAEAFLIHPVDYPLIEAEDVLIPVAEWYRRKGGKQVFVPSYNLKRGHPVLFDAALKKEFLALPDERPARAVLNLRPERIAYIEARECVLMDMDTPEDYARCLALYRARERDRDRK